MAHLDHDGNNGPDRHDGHSSMNRLLILECRMVGSVQDISQVEAPTPHGYDARLHNNELLEERSLKSLPSLLLAPNNGNNPLHKRAPDVYIVGMLDLRQKRIIWASAGSSGAPES